MPPKRIEHMQDIECFLELVMAVSASFQHDPEKIRLWFNTPSPLLANATPMLAAMNGKSHKLLDMMEGYKAE